MQTTITQAMVLAAQSLSTTLLNLVRTDQDDHQTRISTLEASAATIPAGVIMKRGSVNVPGGYLACDGSALNRSDYPNLFTAISTRFNTGGETSAQFRLPDMRGRIPIGSGQGSSLTLRSVGDRMGEENHTVTLQEMPAHTHGVTDPGHTHTTQTAVTADGGHAVLSQYPKDDLSTNQTPSDAMTTKNTQAGIGMIETGGGLSHNNVQPSLVALYVIKT